MSTPQPVTWLRLFPVRRSFAGSHATPFGEPAHGPLTQGYNSHHNGLDIGIVLGTPVHSSMDGKVIYAGWSPIGYGNLVIVQNGDYQTYYAPPLQDPGHRRPDRSGRQRDRPIRQHRQLHRSPPSL